MTDIEKAKNGLVGHSICLCKGDDIITDDGRGISPMIRFIDEGKVLRGYSCADVIVGKAVAMLFAKAGIVAVHGVTMSESAKAFLEDNGISATYEALTPKIINRTGTDICPMEKTVADINNVEEAYIALRDKLIWLQQRAN